MGIRKQSLFTDNGEIYVSFWEESWLWKQPFKATESALWLDFEQESRTSIEVFHGEGLRAEREQKQAFRTAKGGPLTAAKRLPDADPKDIQKCRILSRNRDHQLKFPTAKALESNKSRSSGPPKEALSRPPNDDLKVIGKSIILSRNGEDQSK